MSQGGGAAAPLAHIRQVLLFCPAALSGGPEAIHQLGLALKGLGVPAFIVLVGPDRPIELQPGRMIVKAPPPPHVAQFYAEYQPVYLQEIPLDPQTLVVLPEAMLRHHGHLTQCAVAIWWLSVDNALKVLRDQASEAILGGVFQRPGVAHLAQSAYAREWLNGQGADLVCDLSDYTSPKLTAEPASHPAPRPALSYNAAKGADLAEVFVAGSPEIDALALSGFSRAELLAILRERLIYVDFGHLPGKDRLPREAAVNGGVVFLRRIGAGASAEDFPLPDFYKFDEADVASGELRRRLNAAIADPQAHWDAQAPFRAGILAEKARFEAEAAALFGRR